MLTAVSQPFTSYARVPDITVTDPDFMEQFLQTSTVDRFMNKSEVKNDKLIK